MNLNSGEPWSDLAISDLRYAFGRGDSVESIADFLCRDVAEINVMVAELGLVPPAPPKT